MQRKILGIFCSISLVGILLTGFLSLSFIKSNYMDELEKKLVSHASLINTIIDDEGTKLDSNQLQRMVRDYGIHVDARITLIDKKGNVLADSVADMSTMENHKKRPEVIEALGGEIGTASRYSKTLGEEMFYLAYPANIHNQNVHIIRLAVNLQQVVDIKYKLYSFIGLSVLVGLLASLTLAFRFIEKMVKPIIEMSEVTKKISDGDLEKRITVSSSDEIGELATNFNNMAKRLSETIKELSDSNINLSALLTSIINPIIAVDNNHKIVLLNPAAEQLFAVNAEEAKNMHILEVFRNNILDEELTNILQNKLETQIEISVTEPQEKTLKIHTNLIKPKNNPDKIMGIVILIQDITEIRKLEKMRSGFVANVSHELRTPLTSISGFIETLKSGTIDDEKTKRRFLDIIDIETDRLTRLIDDILTLSDIENTTHKDIRQEILTSDLIKEVEEMMKPVAIAKGVNIISEIESNLTAIYGNRDWFKQMMINLLDNAIKYTNDGGKVHILVYKKYKKIFISVKDSGIGIPKKDLPRLFERFYRVDKARSRKVGGTGLGLAIVKHIVLSFNGKIKVGSEKGKGTEFAIIIPIKKQKKQ